MTLSLKNLFGVVPGSVYGWPKNVLHWQGIDNSIVELAATVPIHYVIADGIVAMEGNGPLHGDPVNLGCLVFADDPVAADGTCCNLMGIPPESIRHLEMGAGLGNRSTSNWLIIGDLRNCNEKSNLPIGRFNGQEGNDLSVNLTWPNRDAQIWPTMDQIRCQSCPILLQAKLLC